MRKRKLAVPPFRLFPHFYVLVTFSSNLVAFGNYCVAFGYFIAYPLSPPHSCGIAKKAVGMARDVSLSLFVGSHVDSHCPSPCLVCAVGLAISFLFLLSFLAEGFLKI